jgi:hypothetical protein
MATTAKYIEASNTLEITNDRGETRTFPAYLSGERGQYAIAFKAMACRYMTGTKVWGADVTLHRDSGGVSVEAGGYMSGGRGGRGIILLGWFADVAESNRALGRG